jgi:hypothetical protein
MGSTNAFHAKSMNHEELRVGILFEAANRRLNTSSKEERDGSHQTWILEEPYSRPQAETHRWSGIFCRPKGYGIPDQALQSRKQFNFQS